MKETCPDNVDPVPFVLRSNFQSSAMFEDSESLDVEGRSTESAAASSLSACKKVRTTACQDGWKELKDSLWDVQVCRILWRRRMDGAHGRWNVAAVTIIVHLLREFKLKHTFAIMLSNQIIGFKC